MTKNEESAEGDDQPEGDYYAHNLKKYKELDIKKIGKNGRIPLGVEYSGRDTRTYISKTGTGEGIEYCNDKIIFYFSEWERVTQVKGKGKGQPLTVNPNGDMYGPHKEGSLVKVLVRKDDNEQ
jgi:hypothetical protein